jgi:hypothetical protein
VSWTFLYLMLFLKLPIVALLWIVWWAIHSQPDTSSDSGDGGIGRRPHPRHPTPRRPRRRGPHGDPVVPAPARVRVARARVRRLDRA